MSVARHTTEIRMAVGFGLLAVVLWLTVGSASGQGALFNPEPEGPGVHLTEFQGGAIDDAVGAVPDAVSFWVTVEGGFVGYIAGAPAFVNTSFTERFPGEIEAGTLMVVVVRADTAPAPSPTTSPTPAPSPAPAACVDINSASLDELRQIVHIDLDRSQQIVALRPLDSVSDLERVSGIGATRVAEIEAEGLACVR